MNEPKAEPPSADSPRAVRRAARAGMIIFATPPRRYDFRCPPQACRGDDLFFTRSVAPASPSSRSLVVGKTPSRCRDDDYTSPDSRRCGPGGFRSVRRKRSAPFVLAVLITPSANACRFGDRGHAFF